MSEHSRPGFFIAMEGIDGCGKSTQYIRLCEHLRAEGHEVVAVREPGGTKRGEAIRSLLLEMREGDGEMAPRAELMLFLAARAQLLQEVIRPALERGAVVVADRFCLSTMAYQGVGRGLGI